MTLLWSVRAKEQRVEILRTIAREQSREDASRWNAKIANSIEILSDFPEAGDVVPEECYSIVPQHPERLRQVLCRPYRIVYESVDGEIHILAIMHSRMLIWSRDTKWS